MILEKIQISIDGRHFITNDHNIISKSTENFTTYKIQFILLGNMFFSNYVKLSTVRHSQLIYIFYLNFRRKLVNLEDITNVSLI